MKRYPAKILLFGEHSVLRGSKALAVPTSIFSGAWTAVPNDSTEHLLPYFQYIQQLQQAEKLLAKLDLATFQADLERGLFFESNIPVGYGLGSSGAVTAAIYDRYATEIEENLLRQKAIFAQLESHFHGSSSGVDPLVCYLHQPLLITPDYIQALEQSLSFSKENYQLFLLDSGKSRSTGTLVNWFLQQCEQTSYFNSVQATLIPAVDNAIAALRKDNFDLLFDFFHDISFFQHRFFQPMIPDALQAIWLDGLSSDYFRLKLCGAGGGGFFIGITKDMERLQAASPFQIIGL